MRLKIKDDKEKGEQGSSLIVVIGAVLILSAMLTGIISTSVTSKHNGLQDANLTAAHYNSQQQNPPFGYVIFSADDTKEFKVAGAGHTIDGNVHVNGDFTLAGSDNHFNQTVEVYHSVKISGSKSNYIKNLVNPSKNLPLPQIDMNYYKSHATQFYNSDLALSGANNTISGIVFVNGDVHISGTNISGNGMIVATGSITFSGSGLQYTSSNDLVAFYSMQDINITGASGTFDGLFYAPNGSIKLAETGSTYNGALVAQSISITGSNDHFEYDSRVGYLNVNQ